MSRQEVQNFAATPGSALISIFDKSESPLEFTHPWGSVLYLRFHDAGPDIEGLELFSVAQAKQVIDFSRLHGVEAPELVVHCHGGVSRSAAIALFLASQYQVPCLKDGTLMTLETWNRPNRYVLRVLREVVDG